MTTQPMHATHPTPTPTPSIQPPAPPFPGAADYLATCRELAPRLLTAQAAREGEARHREVAERYAQVVERENGELRARVAKLEEKVAWLESELATTGRAAQWDHH
jgi:hypothetical protein